jgi:hypothetical protein
MTEAPSLPATDASRGERKPLTPAAKRALAEAEARRKAAEANAGPVAKEFQGPHGPSPDPLWRLGEQGHRLGFLRPEIANCRCGRSRAPADDFSNEKPRECAAFAF